MPFLSFLAGKKEANNSFMEKVCAISGKRIVVFNWLDKSPIRLLQDEAKKVGKFKTVLN